MTPFDNYRYQAWPFRFNCEIQVAVIAGGVPSDPNVIEGWVKTKAGVTTTDQINELVAKTMEERGVTKEAAMEEVARNKHLNGFKRTADGELYLEGRCVKAMIKEAASVAQDTEKIKARGYGVNSRKGVISFFAEHVFVLEDRVLFGVKEPTDVIQKFVHTRWGSSIQYEEVVEDVTLRFTVVTDQDFTDEEWAMILLTGEMQGVGASRSQGYGRFTITGWERDTAAAQAVKKVRAVPGPKPKKAAEED